MGRLIAARVRNRRYIGFRLPSVHERPVWPASYLGPLGPRSSPLSRRRCRLASAHSNLASPSDLTSHVRAAGSAARPPETSAQPPAQLPLPRRAARSAATTSMASSPHLLRPLMARAPAATGVTARGSGGEGELGGCRGTFIVLHNCSDAYRVKCQHEWSFRCHDLTLIDVLAPTYCGYPG
jgi:hypothetical protein